MINKKSEPRKSDTSSLSEAMNDMLSEYNLKNRFDQNRLIVYWEKIMGKAIAQKTGKLFFKGQTLYVEIQSAPLKHELKLGKSKIIKNLKTDIGQQVVEDIVFL